MNGTIPGGYDPVAYISDAYEPCAYDLWIDFICDIWRKKKRFTLCVATSCRQTLRTSA
jgi:hypothetical protein